MATVTVEDIEPVEAPEVETVEETAEEELPKEEAKEEAPAPEPTRAAETPAPKKRGRPKAAPKEAAPKAKPRGRPKKEAVADSRAEVVVEAERPPPTDEEIGEYLRPLLHAYAVHAQMRGRAAKRQHYREIFSKAF